MDIIKTRAEATGISDAEASDVYRLMPASPFRRVIEYDLCRRRELERQSPVRTDKQEGIIEGLTVAIGLLNQKPKS